MADTTTQGRGRLTAERTREVYDAVLALVVEHGYEGLTMDAVAHTASISKATLYRQWGGKQTLVVDALESSHPHNMADTIDTGSLRGDLREWIRVSMSSPQTDIALIHAIMHACMTNEELAHAMRDRMNSDEGDPFVQLFTRAAGRGEIDADSPTLEYIKLVFIGPYILRQFLDGHPPDEAYFMGLVDAVVLPALGIN